MSSIHVLSYTGTLFTLYQLHAFLKECNTRIPIDRLIVVLAGIQWIIAPMLAYHGFGNHEKYHMYVPEPLYMKLSVPGVFLFWTGLRTFRKKDDDELVNRALLKIAPNSLLTGYLLIAAGIGFSLVTAYVPLSLRFLFFLLGNLKYIGLIYLIFSKSNMKRTVIAIAFLATAISSLQSALFHNLILWTILIGMYMLRHLQLKWTTKVTLLTAGLIVIFSIQAVKTEFRKLVWSGAVSGNEITLFRSMLKEEMQTGTWNSASNLEQLIIRLNQGWIISRIMYYTPVFEDYAEGETINDALSASVLPRFLAPGKARAGGQANYERFTGFSIWGTSMGISLLGEGYANFGIYGAWIFIFFCGMGFSLLWQIIFRTSRHCPEILLWIPLIYLQAIKAETELSVVLNHIVKSSFLTFFLLLVPRLLKGEAAKTIPERKTKPHEDHIPLSS